MEKAKDGLAEKIMMVHRYIWNYQMVTSFIHFYISKCQASSTILCEIGHSVSWVSEGDDFFATDNLNE